MSLSLILFFQAEDGIRYWSVTGVQTCALPISAPSYYRPGVPYEAFSYTKQTVAVEQPDNADGAPRQAEKKETPTRMIHSEKIALSALNRPNISQDSESNQSAGGLHVSHISTRKK